MATATKDNLFTDQIIQNYLIEFSQIADQWFKENDWLEARYLFFKDFFDPKNIEHYDWEDFQKLKGNLHSFGSLALAGANALGKPNLPIERYREIFKYIISQKDPIDITINNLFKTYNGSYFLPFFGEATVTELMQYAFPEEYVVYNSRTETALELLENPIKARRGERLGQKFLRFNEEIDPIKQLYTMIVGQKTKTTIPLEVDQFFSWLYSKKVPKKKKLREVIERIIEFSSLKSDFQLKFDESHWGEKYIWLRDSTGLIGSSTAHYEIYTSGENLNLDVHFENKKTRTLFKNEIGELPLKYKWINWNYSQSIRCIESFDITDENLEEKILNGLRDLDNDLGDRIRTAILKITPPRYWVYSPGEDGSLWEEFWEKDIMALGWDGLGDLRLYASKSDIKARLQELEETERSKKNDTLANYQFVHDLKFGDIVFVKSGRGILLGYGEISSDYYFDEKRAEFKSCRKVNWKKKGSWEVDHNLVVKTLTDITDYESELPKFEHYYQRLFSLMDEYLSPNKKEGVNRIFYGPPGTGKTYRTIASALEICGIETAKFSREILKKTFAERIKKGQIVFTTFHQSMTYEDFIEGIKPLEPEKDGDPVIYKVEEGIFKKICIEASFEIAKKNISKSTEQVLDFSIAYDKYLQNIEERLSKGEEVVISTRNGGDVLVDSLSSQDNVIIKHRNGSRTYTVSKARLTKLEKAIDNLEDVNNINDQFRSIIGGSNSSAYWAVLNDIRSTILISKQDKREIREYTIEEKKEVIQSLANDDFKSYSAEPYVLIIDEINRGNVSQIFGELITLLEEDKRLGRPEYLEITLPYSKETFGIPPNLFVIGTMNTADRSVEALDTALRRRFSFEEIPPRYDLEELNTEVAGYPLSTYLETINARIEKLLDKDHKIGHAYFMNVKNDDDLRLVFNDKIIPLLQEYFFGDYGKIGLVLSGSFVKADNSSFIGFSDFAYDDNSAVEDFKSRKVYSITPSKTWDFATIIKGMNRAKDE